jgi:Alkaline phosphatase
VKTFTDQPMLWEMTEKALEILGKNPHGFFLLVEGASIDKQAHMLDWERTVWDAIEMDKAVGVAKRWASDTLVLATARALLPAALRLSPQSQSTESARASDDNDAVVLFTELYKGGSSRGLVFGNKIVALNSKPVVMTGFMAPPLKPALDFFVLTRVPLSLPQDMAAAAKVSAPNSFLVGGVARRAIV